MPQPLNLYFPDHWTALLSDEIEYSLGTGRAASLPLVGYCISVKHVDEQAYGYAMTRAYINLGILGRFNNVPAWVYTHQRDPERHDNRIF